MKQKEGEMEERGVKELAILCSDVADRYQLSLTEALSREAWAHGYHATLVPAGYVSLPGEAAPPENLFFRLPDLSLYDAFVLLLAPLTYQSALADVHRALEGFDRKPWVAIGGDSWHRPAVSIDNVSALHALLDHLYDDHGYRDYLVLLGPVSAFDSVEREQTIRAHLAARAGTRVEFLAGDFWEDHAYQVVLTRFQDALRPRPRVIVACNDNMALGALRALRELGLSCPEDCAVTGFDDVEAASSVFPSLTTVKQPLNLLAREAIGFLVRPARDTAAIAKIPTQFVVRESCGCLPGAGNFEHMRGELSRVQQLRVKDEIFRREVSAFGLAVNSTLELGEMVQLLETTYRGLAFQALAVGLFPPDWDPASGWPAELNQVLKIDAGRVEHPGAVGLAAFFQPGLRRSSWGLDVAFLLFVSGKTFGVLTCRVDPEWTGVAKLVAANLSSGLARMAMHETLRHHAADLEVAVGQRTKDLSDALEALRREMERRSLLEKELHHERAALETILDTQPLPLAVVTEAADQIRYVNKPFLQLLGYEGEAPLEQPWFQERYAPLLARLEGSEAQPYHEISLPDALGDSLQVMARESSLTLRGDSLRIVGMMDLTRQRQLERDLLNITERERERFGQELHDDVCQQIAALSLYIDILGRKLEARLGEVPDEVNDLARLVDGILVHIRGLSRGLFPIEVGIASIEEVFERFLIRMETQTGLTCRLKAGLRDRSRLGADAELQLFRILQEAVQNTLKHAGAQRIEVALTEDARGVSLRYQDDGTGVPRHVREGVGFRSMRYRASQLGTSLVLGRGPLGGLQLELLVPIPSKRKER